MLASTLRIDLVLSRNRVLEVLQKRVSHKQPCNLEAIAQEVNCSVMTVRRAIRDLSNAGKVKRVWRGRGKPSEYEFPDSTHS